MAQIDNPIIGLTEEDVRRLYHPHDDALVVSIWIEDYNTHRVLVDNGSSAYIFYYPAFQQMRLDRERLVPVNAPLVGFGGTRVHPLGAITLFVMVGDYLQQISKDVTFLVVDCSFVYDAILGHPTLNSWKAVTSTYHLMIKFPTKYRVGEVRGDQVVAREWYIAMLEMDDHLQTMCIEEQRTVAKLVEELKEVLLDDARPERTTRIGTLASRLVRQALTAFLKANQDVFAWSHEDMLGIDPSIIVHKLNVSPSFSPIHFVKELIPETGLEGLWQKASDKNAAKHFDWIRKLYNYMTPYVSSFPRQAYVNYRDHDLGINNHTNFVQASSWGNRYIKDNFNKLVKVKRNVERKSRITLFWV
ncbi:uncharacterized protein LOC126696355 [Quercus robur]|uniref:uncharacterized protein LOC126696355 n=1 Tax=Quercus robur TaxID=38942 RepID=UPI002163BEA3|nr:uncharacterized protein LOC126696355 [Quercus robur]